MSSSPNLIGENPASTTIISDHTIMEAINDHRIVEILTPSLSLEKHEDTKKKHPVRDYFPSTRNQALIRKKSFT